MAQRASLFVAPGKGKLATPRGKNGSKAYLLWRNAGDPLGGRSYQGFRGVSSLGCEICSALLTVANFSWFITESPLVGQKYKKSAQIKTNYAPKFSHFLPGPPSWPTGLDARRISRPWGFRAPLKTAFGFQGNSLKTKPRQTLRQPKLVQADR